MMMIILNMLMIDLCIKFNGLSIKEFIGNEF